MRTAAPATLPLLLAVALLAAAGWAADCPCGYLDPTTGALWTDALLTYFNETDAGSDMVMAPAVSPAVLGQGQAGDTGSGAEDWSNVGGQTNAWETAFGATYRSAVLLNNTQLTASQLEMSVQPAVRQSRIVYGAEFVTRRRDIRYGSFRALLNASHAADAGTAFEMSAKYNTSETIDLGLFTADRANESTLQWSYSARSTDASPVSVPLASLLGVGQDGFLEHRFDWTPDSILFGNSNTNLSASTHLVERDDSHTIPSSPVPLSFRHYSNGDPTASEGPPLFAAQVGRIGYARFFFNSSLAARNDEFVQQCAAATTATTCSTEDQTLRGSTAFLSAATLAMPPYEEERAAPTYSLIGITASGGLLALLLLHGLVRRVLNRATAKHTAVPTDDDMASPVPPAQPFPQPLSTSSSSSSGEGEKGDMAGSSMASWGGGSLAVWDPAALAHAQLDKDSEDGDADSDDDGSDDDTLMEDAQEEMDITNDDGLGRPDHVQLLGHVPHHASPDLPRHHGHHDASRAGGYMTPTRTSMPTRPSLIMHHGGGDEQLGSHPPSAWNSLSRPPPSWLAYDSSLSELHQSLLAGGDDGGPAKSSLGHSPSNSLHYDSRRASWADGWAKGRRPSLASLSSMAKLNSVLPVTDGPAAISVWTPLRKPGESKEEQGDMLAARVDNDGGDAKEGEPAASRSWWKRAFAYMFVNEAGAALTASGAARVSYLEGLRGFACFLVSFNHFMLMFWYAATTEGAPTHTNGFETWFYRILTPLLLNQGTKIGIFFVLPARVMGTRYMLRGKLQDLADSTLRRVPRLAFPTFGAVLINYFFIQVDAYKWVPRLASRTWSTWAYFQDYDSVGSFINAWLGLWFTLPPSSPVLLSTYATGVLWTIPVITQSSFAILITVIVSRELPNAYKRYAFYFACIFLSWYANRFDYYFIAGLVIADMDNKLHYREAAARGIPLMPASLGQRLPRFFNEGRVHGQIVGWILFLGGTLIQYLEYLDLPGGDFNISEHGILPNLATSQPRAWQQGRLTENYFDPRFSLFAMVMGIFVLCDLCQSFAGFFMLRWWGAIGRNAFSLYLLHGTIFWTWGAWLCLTLLTAGVPYWVAVTIVFITSYFLLAIFCELFTRTFDAWGVSMSKALWRYTSGGLGRRD